MFNFFGLVLGLLLLCRFTIGSAGKSRHKDNTNSSATIIFAGDISFDGTVQYFADIKKTCSYSSLFKKVKHLLMDADLRVANLESPLLKFPFNSQKTFHGKKVHQFGSVEAVDGLKSAGFDIMQVANNHFIDYGTSGIKSTIEALRGAGIDYVGLRERNRRNQRPLIKTVNGIKIGFLSYCLNKEGCEVLETGIDGNSSSYLFAAGPIVFSKKIAGEDIRGLKKIVDIVVVLIHWSRELSLIPPLGIRNLARQMGVFGANVIIGTHPHVIQGHECSGFNTLTIYSLGNFVFRRNGVDIAFKFLGEKPITKSDIREYNKQMREVYSATQFGYMFRISFSRVGIISAGYIPFEVKNDPKTNCLQPTPLTNKWQHACSRGDSYCTDFQHVYASGEAGLQETLNRIEGKDKTCIQ